MTTCEDKSQLFWFNYWLIKKIAWYFFSESACTEMQTIGIEKYSHFPHLAENWLTNYIIYRFTWIVYPSQRHLKMILPFFLCQSMLTCWCDFFMIDTWLTEFIDHSWYFSLSVINIFTRRNPHLKSLAKEGKVLTAFSRLCTLGCLYSANYVPCQWNLDSMLWSSARFRFLELMYRLQSPWHCVMCNTVQFLSKP